MPDVVSDSKKRIAETDEAEKHLVTLEGELAGLRAAHEQYFMGLERHPPTQRRREFKKRMEELRGTFVQQTALKFRINTLHQKLLTYERMWDRTLQEMENGTYHRDLFKARRRSGQHKAVERDTVSGAKPPAPTDDDDFDVDEDVPVAPKPAPKSSTPVRSADGGALSDDKLKAIYSAYVTAKKRCNEDVSKLSFETVAANLRKQVPQLIKQHNAKGIDFKIVIKDGKAVLRAVPKT